MCIDSVNFVMKGRSCKIEHGFKVFGYKPNVYKKPLRFQIFSNNGSSEVEQRKWLTSRQVLVLTPSGSYKSGFHIYKNKKEIGTIFSNEKLVKVKYKGILAEGLQVGAKVVVAKYMWVSQQRKKQ